MPHFVAGFLDQSTLNHRRRCPDSQTRSLFDIVGDLAMCRVLDPVLFLVELSGIED